jgi:succinyl-CoA synthetase alpha subunit
VLVGSSGTDREFMEDLAWSTWGRSTVAAIGGR